MKYIILVSHGDLAYGFHKALEMLDGSEHNDIIHMGLQPDMGSEVYTEEFKKKIAHITDDDEIFLFGDLGGGSPLTMAANVLGECGFLEKSSIYGGSNLPLILNALLMKDSMSTDELNDMILSEAVENLKKMEFLSDNSDDEI